jgi:hypothetical protein
MILWDEMHYITWRGQTSNHMIWLVGSLHVSSLWRTLHDNVWHGGKMSQRGFLWHFGKFSDTFSSSQHIWSLAVADVLPQLINQHMPMPIKCSLLMMYQLYPKCQIKCWCLQELRDLFFMIIEGHFIAALTLFIQMCHRELQLKPLPCVKVLPKLTIADATIS